MTKPTLQKAKVNKTRSSLESLDNRSLAVASKRLSPSLTKLYARSQSVGGGGACGPSKLASDERSGPGKCRRINRPTSASRLSKQISTISAQSPDIASVVLTVPFDDNDRK